IREDQANRLMQRSVGIRNTELVMIDPQTGNQYRRERGPHQQLLLPGVGSNFRTGLLAGFLCHDHHCGVTLSKRKWISAGLVDLTPGNLNVSNVAALSSKNNRLVRVRREWRALTRSSFPFKIQNPSKIAGMRGTWAALLKGLITHRRLSSGTRVKGQMSAP